MSSRQVSADSIRQVIREELDRAMAWAFPLTPDPSISDVEAERTLLVTLLAGFGATEDLGALGAEHFFDRRTGMCFELVASPLRGGPAFHESTMTRTIAKVSCGTPKSVQDWLDTLRDTYPVCLFPAVAIQVHRVSVLAAWRRFFETMRELETYACASATRGELVLAPKLRKALDALNVDLGRGQP